MSDMRFYYVVCTGKHKFTGKNVIIRSIVGTQVPANEHFNLIQDIERTLHDTYDFSGIDKMMIKDLTTLRTTAYVLGIDEGNYEEDYK